MEEPRVVSIILGGGKGTRLYPLTKERSKPAVSFGGKYRIVDIPISNCINSGYKKIYLLTQFNSVSLHMHITNSYNFDRFSNGFVEIMAAEQTLEHSGWYEGTADAVRKHMNHFKAQNPTHYIILSGDQLYKMDLKHFLNEHIKSGADVTIATTAVNRHDASGFGIMKIDENNRIKEFMEKPNKDLNIDTWKIPEAARGDLPKEKEYLASMGIYIFSWKVLKEALIALKDVPGCDFGKHVIPHCHAAGKRTFAYEYNGYWKDVGTLGSYWEANMELIDIIPEFNLYEEYWKIYTKTDRIPPQFIDADAKVVKSIIGEGSEIYGEVINSVIGEGVVVEKGAVVKDSIIMQDSTVGAGSTVTKAIIAEDVKIGANTKLGVGEFAESKYDPKVYQFDLVTVGEHSVIPDNVEIGKNTAISGVTAAEDYTDGKLESGGYIVKAGGNV